MDISYILFLVVLLAIAGAFTGIVSGLLGIGGGTLLIPVLYELFKFLEVPEAVRMHLAIGTCFGVMIPTAFTSFRKQIQKGEVDIDLLKKWAPSIILGVIGGWFIAKYAPTIFLRGVFGTTMLLLALKMFFEKDSWKIANEMPKGLALNAWGGLVGVLSSILGLGGGLFTTAIMQLHAIPIHKAIATSSGVAILVSIPGIIGYLLIGLDNTLPMPMFTFGFVNFLAIAFIIPLSVYTAPFGVKLSHKLDKKLLSRIFAMYLVFIGAKFLYGVIN